MKINKPLVIAGIATTLGVSSIASLGIASAHGGSEGSMAEKIATKFNINQDEVQAVFDETREEHQAERQAKMSERLQGAVDDGSLTTEQKTLIENKLTELRATMEAEHEALDAWAEQNSIDAKYLMGGHGMRAGNRLDKAVENGDITAEQQAAIETKLEELKAKRDAKHDELEQWAEDNGIDTKFLRAFGGGHQGRGGRGM